MNQGNVSLKTFYAIYDRQGCDRQLVRVISAEDIDAAWELATTLEPGLAAVEDIPPTGEVEFLDPDAVPYTWQHQSQA